MGDPLQHLYRGGDRFGATQQSFIDRISGLVSGLDLTPAGEPMVEMQASHNRWLLSPGRYGGVRFERDHGYVRGLGAAAIIEGQVVISAHTRLVGLTFTQSRLNQYGALLVVDTDEAVVICEDCHFRVEQDTASPLAAIYTNTSPANTGRVAFVNCSFSGNATAAVANAGLATEAYLIGCTKDAAMGWGGNVTLVGAWP
jgi:hypothetical protein